MSASHTVMVVDDDADLRDVIADLLEDAGYRVLTAEHGRAALDLLLGSNDLPRVILLDMMMPVMDGVTFAAERAKVPRLASIPIVVFTAHRDAKEAASSVRATSYLRKPMAVQDLYEVVAGAIQ